MLVQSATFFLKEGETVMRYRTKSVVIEAFQMTQDRRWDNSEWPTWLNKAWNKEPGEGAVWPNSDALSVLVRNSAVKLACGTLEGVYRIDWNDWIIFPFKLGMSSSQLTNSYFSGVWVYHQPGSKWSWLSPVFPVGHKYISIFLPAL